MSIQKYDLHDVISNDIPTAESTDMFGFHLVNQGHHYDIQPDGYSESLESFDHDEYDDILPLVNHLHLLAVEFWYECDDDQRIEWGGKPMSEYDIPDDSDINLDRGEGIIV